MYFDIYIVGYFFLRKESNCDKPFCNIGKEYKETKIK